MSTRSGGNRLAALLAALAMGGSAVLGLSACDPQRIEQLEEGVSTEADVRTRFGQPENVWDAPGVPGGRVLEYNRQPQGQKNYMITIGADGRMSALRQVLTPENFARVRPGMAMEDVRKLLGKPARVVPYALKRETEWEWRWVQPPNTPMVFSVVLDRDQRVVRSGSSADRAVEPN